MRMKIAMALISVIFMLVVAIISDVFHLLPDSDEAVLLELMSTISLFGSVLFLSEARKVLPSGIWQSRFVFRSFYYFS